MTIEIASEIDKVPFWWHKINLDGHVTPGHLTDELQQIRASVIPTPLKGKTVLDIGCWDGYFSFWCEDQGAIVTAIDDFQYRKFVKHKYGINLRGGEGFDLCKRLLDSKVIFRNIDFMEIDGTWDLVLFMGVIYHQRHPLLALEHLFRLTSGTAVIETLYQRDTQDSTLTFLTGDTTNSDPTNFWKPSLSCMVNMLEDVGFGSVKLEKTYGQDVDRAVFIAKR